MPPIEDLLPTNQVDVSVKVCHFNGGMLLTEGPVLLDV